MSSPTAVMMLDCNPRRPLGAADVSPNPQTLRIHVPHESHLLDRPHRPDGWHASRWTQLIERIQYLTLRVLDNATPRTGHSRLATTTNRNGMCAMTESVARVWGTDPIRCQREPTMHWLAGQGPIPFWVSYQPHPKTGRRVSERPAPRASRVFNVPIASGRALAPHPAG